MKCKCNTIDVKSQIGSNYKHPHFLFELWGIQILALPPLFHCLWTLKCFVLKDIPAQMEIRHAESEAELVSYGMMC